MNSSVQISCSDLPSDAVSRIHFINVEKSEDGGDLLVSSWDGSVSLYNSTHGRLVKRCENFSSRPLLACCTLNPIGSLSDHSAASCQFVAGGLSGEVLMGDFTDPSTPSQPLGKHDKAVSCVDFLAEEGVVFSGSWDTTVKVWDVRACKEVQSLALDAKVFSLAVSNAAKKVVICDSQKTVTIYDARKLSEPEFIRTQSQPVLKYQFRDVVCFPDATGYAVASIEGRVAWEYFDPALGPGGSKKNYAFKCHREKEDGTELIYPVNALAFNYVYNSFATGGSDSTVSIWDGYNKKRLWKSSVLSETQGVSSLSFSREGLSLAIALSDGKKDFPKPRVASQLFVRTMKPEEVSPRSVKKT